jgi:hypothetical protein
MAHTKIFLTWSGERSAAIAKALREWLPLVIQDLLEGEGLLSPAYAMLLHLYVKTGLRPAEGRALKPGRPGFSRS